MDKFIVIEMQNGSIGGNNWSYDDRADAEVKFYQVLADVVKSPVEVHTVMLVNGEGLVLDCKSYDHRDPEETVTEGE